jgi:hypothetical protein
VNHHAKPGIPALRTQGTTMPATAYERCRQSDEQACENIAAALLRLERAVRHAPPHLIVAACQRLNDLLESGPYTCDDTSDVQETVSAFADLIRGWNDPISPRSRRMLACLVSAIETQCEIAEADM